MKKILIIVCVIVMILFAFLLGQNMDTLFNKEADPEEQLVGVYETASWNGEPAILVLCADGTCQYPTNRPGNWALKEDTVLLTVRSMGYDNGRMAMTAYFDLTASKEEIKSIAQKVKAMEHIDYINLILEDNSRLYIRLTEEDTSGMIQSAILALEGVSSVEYQYLEVETYSEHEAKIMENGLVLHGNFFEKKSN